MIIQHCISILESLMFWTKDTQTKTQKTRLAVNWDKPVSNASLVLRLKSLFKLSPIIRDFMDLVDG